jgi:hypothetical protein
MTWCPLAISKAVSAVPPRPPAPVTAIASRSGHIARVGGQGSQVTVELPPESAQN